MSDNDAARKYQQGHKSYMEGDYKNAINHFTELLRYCEYYDAYVL